MRLVLVLLVASCGDNTVDLGEPRSGSRLKLAWYEYTDGTRQLETEWYFDAERGERCTPVRWSDGARYCTPAAKEAVYVDPTCARALGRVPRNTQPAPYFARYHHMNGVRFPSRLASIGAPSSPPLYVWELHDGTCRGPYSSDGAYDYYELGEVLASDGVVRVDHSRPQGGDDIIVVFDLSSDGLRGASTILDRASERECITSDRPNATAIECMPDDTSLASYFHDSRCTELEIAVTTAAIPSLARHHSPESSCSSYFELGAETSASPLYRRAGDDCLNATAPGGARLFLAGPAVDLPTLERQLEPTERRLARITRVHGAQRADDPLLHDTALEADCERRANNEELRCVPSTTARVMPVFADAACATSIEVAFVPGGACDPPSRFATKETTFYPVQGAYATPMYELTTGDRCREYVPPVPMVLHAIGEPLPASAFVAAELTIDR